MTLRFLHQDYVPVDLSVLLSDKLTIVHLVPIHRDTDAAPAAPLDHPPITVANVRIRYSTESTTQENIGTGVKTFRDPKRGKCSLPEQFPMFARTANGRPPSTPNRWMRAREVFFEMPEFPVLRDPALSRK